MASQAEYDADPDLQGLLTEAAASPAVHRVSLGRDNIGSDADDIAQRALNKDADLIQGLREDGAGDG